MSECLALLAYAWFAAFHCLLVCGGFEWRRVRRLHYAWLTHRKVGLALDTVLSA